MTTMAYTVAYPHPEVSRHDRIERLRCGSDDDGRTLIDRLCDIYPDHRDDLKKATFWKASGLDPSIVDNESKVPIYEWIKAREENLRIKRYEVLGRRFPDGPKLGLIEIVVVTPEILEDMDHQGDTDGNFQRMRARLAFSRTLGGITSPSDCVKSHTSVEATVLDPGGPRYGRPSDRFGPPTALFNNALAVLKYDLGHLGAFTPLSTTVDRAFNLISSSTDFFERDDARGSKLRDILQTLLSGKCKWQESAAGGATKPGGTWQEGSFTYLIFELKNEPGLGGDPFLQCLAVYSKIVKQEEYTEFCLRSNLPVVLLSMSGNHLEIATAIFTDAVYADKLLSLDLRLGFHGPDNVLHVARMFMAINKCTERLRKLYRDLKGLSGTLPGVLYPNPTADPPESTAKTIPGLEFFCKLDRVTGVPISGVVEAGNKRHAIYLARMASDTPAGDSPTRVVLVKFTAKYNEAAHRLLADHKPPLAPALYCYTRVVGDLYMVVMEYVSGASALHHFTTLSPFPFPRPPNAKGIRRDLTKALELLHGKDFVFGDLRPMNILYSPKDDRALLVDFDGVGKHGEDRYSPCLNTLLGLGVDRWQIMEKSHDSANFERVMKWLSDNAVVSGGL